MMKEIGIVMVESQWRYFEVDLSPFGFALVQLSSELSVRLDGPKFDASWPASLRAGAAVVRVVGLNARVASSALCSDSGWSGSCVRGGVVYEYKSDVNEILSSLSNRGRQSDMSAAQATC
jgi:hypothetical protein